jgi:opacity protein-like surface antigen
MCWQILLPPRHRILHVAGLLAPLLGAIVLAPLAARAETDDVVTRTPDFRFTQPWLTLGLRGGYSFNRSEAQIYDFLKQNLTLSHSDFDGPAMALDVGVRATSWMDVVLGFEFTQSKNDAEFRYFVEDNREPIEQETRITQVPLTLSLRFYPLGRGRAVASHAWIRSLLTPYVGGGVGGTWYELRQDGDFVDTTDLSIFEAKLKSDGWAFSQHVMVGVDIRLTRNFGVVMEARYHWAEAHLGGDFIGFNNIDLDGARAMIGFSMRI